MKNNTKEIALTPKEEEALEKLAKVSKMDCWFSIDEFGVWDRENKKHINTSEAIIELLDGATYSDILHTGPDEAYIIINLLIKIIKKQNS